MNKLKQEIFDKIDTKVTDPSNPFWTLLCKEQSKLAAEVAMKWLNKLVTDFEDADLEDSHLRSFFEKWKKENEL